MATPTTSSRVILVFSTKGGAGKTVTATNLAVSLAQGGASTALLDCDPFALGDAASLLHVTPAQALVEICARLDPASPWSPEQVSHAVTKHPSGLEFLPLVRAPTQVAQIHTQWFPPLLAALRQRYQFIVIDAGRGLTSLMFALLDESNVALLVAIPDIASLSQVKWVLECLTQMLYPPRLVRLVLNRAQSRGGLSLDDVRGVVACEVVAAIPSDGATMGYAVNQGIPVVINAANTKIAQAFRQLANACSGRFDLYLEPVTDAQALARRKTQQQALTAATEHPALRTSAAVPSDGQAGDTGAAAVEADADPLASLRRRVHESLVEKLNLRKMDPASLGADREKVRELRAKTEAVIVDLLSLETGAFLQDAGARARLVKEIADEALGLGPLEDLLADPAVNDILVNNQDQIYIERRGKLELSEKKFSSNDQLRTVIERIVAPLGRRIDEASPMVDARLPDGSRVNAIIPPLALRGPTISIRKFSRQQLTTDDLVRFGSVTPEVVRFLEACVRARKNIIISGGTGSGKTTFLNIVSSFIPNNERIITIEDAAELRLDQEHLVSLESRPPNVEGKGAITIRDLFRNALRMRPDRIVIGECRGGETLDMLQAMNTGHDGSLTTIHANSPRDCIARLDSLVLMSSVELPVRAIREQIVSAVDLVVHTARLSDGSRKVTAVSEIVRLKENLEVEFNDLFVFHQTGIEPGTSKVLGRIAPTGALPTFMDDLKARGLDLGEEFFKSAALHHT